MKYPNGYLQRIQYYTKEIVRVSNEMLYCHPKYVVRKRVSLSNTIQKLNYYVSEHAKLCEV
jgi:hypothetical protein